jgi:P27 family predicted phage terminase small subunit
MPTHLAVVDKAHKHRHNNQPSPSKDWPVAPDRLTEQAKAYFNELVAIIAELYPPSASHEAMLTMYAEAKELSIHLEHMLRVEGLTYMKCGPLGDEPKARPEVMMLERTKKQMFDILREFGLSPSAQRSVKIEKPKSKVNAFADLDDVAHG